MPKATKLPGSHHTLMESFRLLAQHKRLLLGVSLLGAVVNMLLRLGGAEAALFYQSIWFVFVLGALIWSVRHAGDSRVKPNLRKAYFGGTAPTLKLIVVLMVLSLASLPFSLGAFLYSAVGVVTVGATAWWEQAIGIGLWSVFALLSLMLLSRWLFALFITSLPDIGPVVALRSSWRLSKGSWRALLVRFLVLFVYGGLAALLLLLVLNWFGLSTGLQAPVYDLLGMGLLMPLVLIYSFKLYEALR